MSEAPLYTIIIKHIKHLYYFSVKAGRLLSYIPYLLYTEKGGKQQGIHAFSSTSSTLYSTIAMETLNEENSSVTSTNVYSDGLSSLDTEADHLINEPSNVAIDNQNDHLDYSDLNIVPDHRIMDNDFPDSDDETEDIHVGIGEVPYEPANSSTSLPVNNMDNLNIQNSNNMTKDLTHKVRKTSETPSCAAIGNRINTTNGNNINRTIGNSINTTNGNNINRTIGNSINTTNDNSINRTIDKNVNTNIGNNINTTIGKSMNTTIGNTINTTIGNNINTTNCNSINTIPINDKEPSPHNNSSLHKSPAMAGEPAFLSEFYSNSRLHHLSTWKSEWKEYVGKLQSQNTAFPGRQKLSAYTSEKISSTSARVPDACFSKRGKPDHVIMHIDMDCFFVSVGLRNRPDLKGRLCYLYE